MRPRTFWLALAAIAAITPLRAEKLTQQERIELLRSLSAEYATVKTMLPRSKKPLPFESSGTWDKKLWADAARELGPAARIGDLVQITKVEIEDDRILLEINGGLKSGRKWYERVEVGMGNRTSPINSQGNPTAGTNIALLFGKPVPALPSLEIKKLLLPILDFEKRSVTESYVESLPPEIQSAIKANKAVEGMDREQVLIALGRPRHKTRETKDGLELEDWIYGMPPGKITFVTFNGSKVMRVKEAYAGLGGTTADPIPQP